MRTTGETLKPNPNSCLSRVKGTGEIRKNSSLKGCKKEFLSLRAVESRENLQEESTVEKSEKKSSRGWLASSETKFLLGRGALPKL